MKSVLLLTFIGFTQLLLAQSFSEITTDTPLPGPYYGSVAFSDINGDGYPDVLITGQDEFGNSGNPLSKLYLNDGTGNFTEKTGTSLAAVGYGAVAFSDVNGDNSPDLFIIGQDNTNTPISKLYLNDGTGNFFEMENSPFEGVNYGLVAFADVNNDGSPDLLLAGITNTIDLISKIYLNDGTGNFTEKTDVSLKGLGFCSGGFSDVNSDGYPDILMVGLNSSNDPDARLYLNDGLGNFTEMENTPFEKVYYSSTAFADVNNDGYSDILITGQNRFIGGDLVAKVYTNDGAGNFTEIMDTPFEGIRYGSVAFSDANRDGHQDILITGLNRSIRSTTKLYTNDGSGNFTEAVDLPFEDIAYSSVAFADVNRDGSEDVLLAGIDNLAIPLAKVYLNEIISSIFDTPTELAFDFTLFPNPTEVSTININLTSKIDNLTQVTVFDLHGRLLLQNQLGIGTTQYTLDVSNLGQGIYILELANGVKKSGQKFTIQ